VSWSAKKIALIGDLHGQWNERDNEFFDRGDYDCLLFVGDLGTGTRKSGLEMIRSLSRLRVPGLVMPGNNDAEHLPELEAELAHQAGKNDLMQLVSGQSRAGIEPCGYSSHRLEVPGGEVTLIAGRPCAMGGSVFSFAAQLERSYGTASLEGSKANLRSLVDTASTEHLVFIGHNGPFGMGDGPEAMWGRDFDLPEEGDNTAPRDWGDSDLAHGIAYARQRDKTVLAVVAGHMHRRPRNTLRPLCSRREQTAFVNPAMVPRIQPGEDGELHHHVELSLDLRESEPEKRVRVVEKWVSLEY